MNLTFGMIGNRSIRLHSGDDDVKS